MSITLTYFDFNGSRGLECRLALHTAGVEFKDVRIDGEQWKVLKPTLPFGALPVLSNGDKTLAQTNAILRVVGRFHGIHPEDPWVAAEHDAIMQSVEELREKVRSKPAEGTSQQAAREAFASGWLASWATHVSARIEGPFLEGETLHVADIKLFVIVRAFLADVYDFLPGTVLAEHSKLLALHKAVGKHPAVKAHLESFESDD